ncbi:MAG: methyltransferase domain-containing protein [Deltaproteobacteria bacterium]|nr:methyltransferase domain-containing protein [Deltaproteobacteria bacterium]
MSKRDEDSQSDMEVGMTTAERRRRRRRGGGLRVPSDNVPRSRTPTAPPAPVPEDPALAMSIAYSFKSDASGPVPRQTSPDEDWSGPIAPEAASTVIDPPDAGKSDEPQDFEMKTREMSSVDLSALGLEDPANPATTLKMPRVSQPSIEIKVEHGNGKSMDVDVDVTVDEPITSKQAALATSEKDKHRLKTVALSEDDLEEVRAATQPSVPPEMGAPAPAKKLPGQANKTMQLSIVDVEEMTAKGPDGEPVSVNEIDIQELADRAEQSGEIEVKFDDKTPTPQATSPAQAPTPKRATTVPPAPPPTDVREVRKSGAIPAIKADDDAKHAPPPPPTAAQHKPPPAPPPAAKKPPPAAVVAVVNKEPSKPTNRGKPWFAEIFDEDYLRTLPFLTPQATQSEAEFVIDTMNLAPGANVLDVGCGYGRHAMELAARGFHVVGLDLSTPLLVRGGEEAHRRGLTINFVRGDMRELDFENQFDAAYCLFSTFGYFDDETNKKTLQNIGRALKPQGKMLIEILNRDYVIQDLPTRVWWEGDGCVVLEEVELNYFSSRIQVNRSVVFDDGRQLEQEISVRGYSLHEVGKLMHAAGFRVLEVSGGYQMRGRFFGNQSRHIIVLAERKETT